MSGNWLVDNPIRSNPAEFDQLSSAYDDALLNIFSSIGDVRRLFVAYSEAHSGTNIETLATEGDTMADGLRTLISGFDKLKWSFLNCADGLRRLEAQINEVGGLAELRAIYESPGDPIDGGTGPTAAIEAEYDRLQAAETKLLRSLASSIEAAPTGSLAEVNMTKLDEILDTIIAEVKDPDVRADILAFHDLLASKDLEAEIAAADARVLAAGDDYDRYHFINPRTGREYTDAEVRALRKKYRNPTVNSKSFTVGGSVDVPVYSGIEVTVGAEVQLQRDEKLDGTIIVKARFQGSLGTDLADSLGIKANGALSTDYEFDNEEEAQAFMDDLKEALDTPTNYPGEFVDTLTHRNYTPGKIDATRDVLNDYEGNHKSYKGSLELQGTAQVGNGTFKLGAKIGAERNFSTDETRYYGEVNASAATNLSEGLKMNFDGSVRVEVVVDDNGDPKSVAIVGSVSGSGPVNNLVDSVSGSFSESETKNVIPGTKNKETIKGTARITLDATNVDDQESLQNLVEATLGTGDSSFKDSALDTLDRATVKVDVTATESNVTEIDSPDLRFKIGNSESETVASFTKPPNGETVRVV